MTRVQSILPVFALLLCVQTATAGFNDRFWENRSEARQIFSLAPELSFYTTRTNYDATGGAVAVPGLNHYRRSAIKLDMAYGLSSKLSAYATLNWSGVDESSATRTGRAYGLGDQSIGVNYRLLAIHLKRDPSDPVVVHLQAQTDMPAYKNATAAAANAPFIGDGTVDATIGGLIAWPIVETRSGRRLALHAGAGYTWRSDAYAPRLPWSLQFDYETASRLGAAIGVGGTRNLRAGEATDVRASGSVRFALSRSGSLEFGLQRSLMGTNTAAGLTATLGASWFWDLGIRRNPVTQTPSQYGKGNRGFVNYGPLEAKVTRINDRLHLVKIDKGAQDGVEKDLTLDIFRVAKDGSVGEAIARGKVVEVKGSEATLHVTEYFKAVWIEEGQIVKRPLD